MTPPDGTPPDGFVVVASTADIPPGRMKCVAIDGMRVLVANVEGAFYAIGDMCGHRRAPLSGRQACRHIVLGPLPFTIFHVWPPQLPRRPHSSRRPRHHV